MQNWTTKCRRKGNQDGFMAPALFCSLPPGTQTMWIWGLFIYTSYFTSASFSPFINQWEWVCSHQAAVGKWSKKMCLQVYINCTVVYKTRESGGSIRRSSISLPVPLQALSFIFHLSLKVKYLAVLMGYWIFLLWPHHSGCAALLR